MAGWGRDGAAEERCVCVCGVGSFCSAMQKIMGGGRRPDGVRCVSVCVTHATANLFTDGCTMSCMTRHEGKRLDVESAMRRKVMNGRGNTMKAALECDEVSRHDKSPSIMSGSIELPHTNDCDTPNVSLRTGPWHALSVCLSATDALPHTRPLSCPATLASLLASLVDRPLHHHITCWVCAASSWPLARDGSQHWTPHHHHYHCHCRHCHRCRCDCPHCRRRAAWLAGTTQAQEGPRASAVVGHQGRRQPVAAGLACLRLLVLVLVAVAVGGLVEVGAA
mmetsp:Transcript_39001/g.111447  ORF Transcript_39001/g.111447 Transcript_39001/m.111447 type:complete len:279 (-) Transcript_39001:2628-3464(-)